MSNRKCTECLNHEYDPKTTTCKLKLNNEKLKKVRDCQYYEANKGFQIGGINMIGKELKEILNNLTEEQLQASLICEIEFTGYWGVVEHKIAEENMYYDSEFNDCLIGESILLKEEENFNDFELIIKKGDPYLVIK